jgi:uncharacterized delta-60 repeat protein
MSRRQIFVTAVYVVLLCFWAWPALAELIVDTAWVRTYNGPENGDDIPAAMAIDSLGNVYVTGYSWNAGLDCDYVTIKYFPNGDTAWVRRYNGPGDPSNSMDRATAMAVDNSGNVYVTGRSEGSGTYADFATIKYDENGDTIWVRRYNGLLNADDFPSALAIDIAGNAYVTGYNYDAGTDRDYVTIGYHPNGDTAWVRRYDGPGNSLDFPYAAATDNSGNIYVTGSSYGMGTNQDCATVKYYPNGYTAWVKRYDGPANLNDLAYALAVDVSGNVYVTGQSRNDATHDDYITIKYLSNGDTSWVRRYNGPTDYEDVACDVAVDNSGNVLVTGVSNGIGTYDDWATIKYYPNGDTAWARRYNGPDNLWDGASALAVDKAGNVYVTGWSGSIETSDDYTTIKYYPNGDTAWVRRYDGSGNSYDNARAIAVDGSGNVYVTGKSPGSGTSDDYATIKYFQALRGDATRDGIINGADVVYMINYLFRNGDPPNPMQAGDCNCDGSVGGGDVVYLINYLFRDGPPPGC